MFKKTMLGMVFLIFFSLSICAFAEDVVITSRGAKYHKEECRLVKGKTNIKVMEKDMAIEEDYGPCRRCFKEDLAVEEKVGAKEE